MHASSPLLTKHQEYGTAPSTLSIGPDDVENSVSHGREDEGNGNNDDRLQIHLLCYVRMMEPLAFYTIFPYIAQMIEHNSDLPESDLGFYSGLFESLFSAVQVLVLIFWGSMADRVGYKRLLLCSLSGMSVAPVLFGFSTSLSQMALFRCLTGLFSGGNVIIRSMLMYRCTPDTQARTFGRYAFADSLALFLGPLLGGSLADPAAQYPHLFGGWSLFERFPFALPGIVTGAACMSGVLVTVFFIDDVHVRDGDHAGEGPGDARRPSLWKLFRAPGVVAALCTLMHVRLLVSSMVAVSTTALYIPVDLGGMGYSPRQIATLIAAQAALEAVWLLFVFPPLHRRIGTKGILYLCAAMFPLVFADYAAVNELLRDGSQLARAAYLVCLAGLAVLGSGVFMASVSGQLALQNMSPDPRMLGSLNAVAESCASVVKTATPALSTSIFAVGVRSQLLDGNLAWFVLMLISPALFATTRLLPRTK